LLSSRQRPPHARGEDRRQVIRAREAAELLFAPKPSATLPSVQESTSAEVRKPRVLQIIRPAPAERDDLPAAPPAASEPRARAIPGSEFARIRTWVKYGMTISQVAELYDANDAEIERIIRTI
jgi:hypothetical protein